MLFQIAQVPNYKKGESYRSYSPDGRYMMDLIFPQGRNSNILLMLTDLDLDQVVQLTTLPDDDIDILELWVCKELNSKKDARIKKPCYEYTPKGDAGRILTLPPSWWSQLHAWLTIQIRGTKDAQLDVVEIHKWYPPVKKKQ
jgi:hypothetical protein